MKKFKSCWYGFMLAGIVLSPSVFAQLTDEDRQDIQSLVGSYSTILAACNAEGFADLFVPDTGYFSSGFRGHIVGRERLIALVKSERHCDVPAGSAPTARPSSGNAPELTIDLTSTGARGITNLGAAHYEDEYVKTSQGWRMATRTVIIAAEKAAGIDANEMRAINALQGTELVDYYITNESGTQLLMTSGVSIQVADGVVTGHAYVEGGGYNNDEYEKLGPGQWRIKSRTFVPAEAP